MNCTTFASLYGATAQSGTGCSAVGSAPGLGPGGRPFESGHPDNKAKERSKRNLQKGLAKRNKRCTFAAQLRNGALDEWLSQRSAKPSTAVRIRQAPPLKGKAIEKDIPTKDVFFVFPHSWVGMSESVEENIEIRGSEELNSWEGILGFVEAGS